ncbi:FecCD family ABC transporter permease, partial [Leucobacter sp. M11]|uniref:FecCD family ABC transporter permease n=1 Tax=Leucobacter sp. M11 TaxID=2993565 RepID=UPI002D7EA0FC
MTAPSAERSLVRGPDARRERLVTSAGGAAEALHRPGRVTHTRGRILGLGVLTLLLVLSFLASLAFGAKGLGLAEVWAGLRLDDGGEAAYIVRELRLPRAVLGLVVGAALGVSGALIQALTRNPLADPGILGVNAGAGFFVTMGIAFFGAHAISQYLWFAFAGAIIVTVLVYLLGSVGRVGATPIRLTLVGVALGALLGGITSGITMLNPKAFDSMRSWSAGSLSGRGWDILWAVLPWILLGLALALL